VNDALPKPDRNRLSVLAALVLIIYGLLRIVQIPAVGLQLSLFGILFRIEFDTRLVMLILSAALTVSGTDWLLRTHPLAVYKKSTLDHLVIPGLAAFGLGSILSYLPAGIALWIGFAITAALLLVLLTAEYLVLDPKDPRYEGAALGIKLLAYILLVGFLFAMRATGMRAAFEIPLVLMACAGVAWRLLKLGVRGASMWRYALLIGFVIAQIAWALHYWPTPPLQEALILGLTAYVAVEVILSSMQRQLEKSRILELAAVGLGSLLIALVLT
jgi:hypothetical protein